MAKDKYDRRHRSNLSAYGREIDRLYREIITQAVAIGVSLPDFKPDKLFSFDDYPALRKRVERLLQAMQDGLSSIILNGIKAEWTLANNKNSELARQVFGDNAGKLPQAQYRRYFSTNDSAREAFEKRKVNGLSLSDRVWRYTDQFKEEIELGLDVGIRNGLSADEMSQELRRYLKYPDRLFRRVRDEHGELRLSKRAAAFHPGRGVYRSSYKNARRLAATETNIAYMTADYERWQQLDFVVGIRIVMSNNHTLNGRPFTDICDRLSAPPGSTGTKGRGCYPKGFKFTGWHPLCRCHVETILKTDGEIAEDTRRILDGERPDGKSVNRVDDVPDNFKRWLQDNKERYKAAEKRGTLPYFIRDNKKVVDGILNAAKLTPQEVAEIRHKARTDDNVRRTKLAAWDRQLRMNMPNLTVQERSALADNWLEIEKALGVKKGRMMTIEEADRQKANPKYGTDRSYSINCQTCSPAYMLRQWGFNVTAKGKTPGSLSEYLSRQHSFEAWQNIDGTEAAPVLQRDWLAAKGYKRFSEKRWKEYFEENCKEVGTYLLTIGWKGGGGHATILQRTADGLFYIEPQVYNDKIGAKRPIDELCKDRAAKPLGKRGILRIDNKIFVKRFLSIFDK